MAKTAASKAWAVPLRSDGNRYSKSPVVAPTAIARTVDSSTQITLQASGGSSGLGTNAGYRYRRNGLLLNSVATASPYVDSGLTNATTYNYTATLVDSNGNESDWSAVFAASTPAASDTVPPTAAVIAAQALSASTIKITLTTPATDAGSGFRDYSLQTSVTASGPWTDLLTAIQAASLPFTHAGIPASTTRFYRLVAFDNVGNSTPSAVVSATTQASSGQTGFWTGILDTIRGYDWTRCGVRGGIPVRTTIFQTLNPGATIAQINTAIQNCPANQVVKLNAGTYNLAGGFELKTGVTLRGAGADQTNIIFSAPSNLFGLGADVAAASGYLDPPGPQNQANWTAGLARGSTVITLSSVANLAAGHIMILNQTNDTSVPANDIVTGSGLPFSYDGGGGGGLPGQREQTEIVEVVSISGNNVTITPPIRMPNWTSTKSPRAWWLGVQPISKAGIEGMSLDHSASNGNRAISYMGTKDCWVLGVKGRYAGRSHAWMYASMNWEIRDSYFYEGKSHASQSYGIETMMDSDGLIINNILTKVTAPFLRAGSTVGQVCAYNYTDLDTYSGSWQQNSSYFHGAGNAYILEEGNQGTGMIADQVHGPASLVCCLRNNWNGHEPGKTEQTTPFNDYANSRFFSAIGNVLGEQGFHSTYESAAPSGSGSDKAIYVLSWGNNGTAGGGSNPANDTFVKTSLMRWGNCDAVNGWIPRFDSTEVPSAIPGQYSNAVPLTQVIPASFFLAQKPAFFGAVAAWPPAGPDVTGGDVANKGGRANRIPAKRLFDALTKDSNGEITNFNPAGYYS